MSNIHAVRSLVETGAAIRTSNIVPSRATRINLQIFLTGVRPETQLAHLLRSSIGVYVTATASKHDAISVTFEIADQDVDFTLHMVMSTVSEATIGSIVRKSGLTIQ